MKKALIALLICASVVLVAAFAGPVASGAIFMLLPNGMAASAHDLPDSYTPVHKGGVDLETGLYIRGDEDLVVNGTPALILRRTYLSNDRHSRQFGIGTTHNGEWAVAGESVTFQSAALKLETGTRIEFTRVSPGTSVLTAIYEHHSAAPEWDGARLGWTGVGWALQRRDGMLAIFQPCGAHGPAVCSIIKLRDSDGHTIDYRRDREGRLTGMETSDDRWIRFTYDGKNRIARAYTSIGTAMRYEYDEPGRLVLASSPDGVVRRYDYADRDRLKTAEGPERTTTNTYDRNGRCVHQENSYADGTLPTVFDFAYRLRGESVAQTDVTVSDGTWKRYTFENRYTMSESWGASGLEPATFTYERDRATGAVTALTLTCPDRSGRPLEHSSLVKPGAEARIKWDLLQTHCSWRRRPAPEAPRSPAGS